MVVKEPQAACSGQLLGSIRKPAGQNKAGHSSMIPPSIYPLIQHSSP
ncbi:hypothetical protein [Paenibacillus sp. MMO-177]